MDETHEHEKQVNNFTPRSSSFAGEKENPALAKGLWSAGHTVTSAVFFPANPNSAGEGIWTGTSFGPI